MNSDELLWNSDELLQKSYEFLWNSPELLQNSDELLWNSDERLQNSDELLLWFGVPNSSHGAPRSSRGTPTSSSWKSEELGENAHDSRGNVVSVLESLTKLRVLS